MISNQTGKTGEEYVVQHVKKAGYEIVETNYRTRFGEIDIIASDSTYLLFIEVKTRKMGSMSHPLEAVTRIKKQKIILAAQGFLQQHPSALQPRFDVAAVYTTGGRVVDMQYIENAFTE